MEIVKGFFWVLDQLKAMGINPWHVLVALVLAGCVVCLTDLIKKLRLPKKMKNAIVLFPVLFSSLGGLLMAILFKLKVVESIFAACGIFVIQHLIWVWWAKKQEKKNAAKEEGK